MNNGNNSSIEIKKASPYVEFVSSEGQHAVVDVREIEIMSINDGEIVFGFRSGRSISATVNTALFDTISDAQVAWAMCPVQVLGGGSHQGEE